MKINPPGMPPSGRPPRGSDGGIGNGVATPKTSGEAPAGGADRAAPPGVASRYTRADLAEPKTLETIVRQAIDELIEADSATAARLPESGRRELAEFMAGDPIVRRQVERWLEKVLK